MFLFFFGLLPFVIHPLFVWHKESFFVAVVPTKKRSMAFFTMFRFFCIAELRRERPVYVFCFLRDFKYLEVRVERDCVRKGKEG